jgi:hypothetical protein
MNARVSAGGILRRPALAMVLLVAATPVSAQQNQLRAEWNRNVTEYRGQTGRRITLVCPANGQVGDVWGTDTYTDDSPVCPAAVHAGVITAQSGGVVTVVMEAGRGAYTPSLRNGVSSKPFGSWQSSFSFARAGDGRIDWTTNAAGLTPDVGRPITLECPAGGSLGRLYGTDTYTDDSSICTAAVHAGVITRASGGRVTIEATGPQAAFAASVRNGVSSQDYATWPNGFRFSGTALAIASVPAPEPAAAPAVSTPPASATSPTPPPPATTTSSATTTPPVSSAPPASSTPPGTVASANGAVLANAGVARPSAGTAASDKAAGAVVPSAALAAPTAVVATSLGAGQVFLTWNPVPGAALYHINYRKVGDSQWAALTDRPGDPLPTTERYQSDPQQVLLPAGTLEFQVFAARDGDDWTGARSLPVRMVVKKYDGRYRVTLNGFRVNRETIDSPLNYDGQHDEIYVRVGVREYDGDGNALGNEQVPFTMTHGDINAARWKQEGTTAFRRTAGTAAAFGGLKTGDGFPNPASPWAGNGAGGSTSFPLFVWEGYLREGHNAVAIMPVIYEDDESMWELKPETQALLDVGVWVAARGQEQVQNVAGQYKPIVRRKPALGPDVGTLKSFTSIAGAINPLAVFGNAAAVWAQRQQQLAQRLGPMFANLTAASSLVLNTKDRPIGLAGIEGGKLQFDPQILRLSFESAEQFIANKQTSNPSIPAGIVEVRYQDTIPGGNGDYSLYLQITRVQ